MKAHTIEVFRIKIPFRFSFAHSLANRNCSENLLVKVTLEDGTCGWGESVPRDYVTGENIENAEDSLIKLYAPEIIGLDFPGLLESAKILDNLFFALNLDKRPAGASWCALELAILDALSKSFKQPLETIFGGLKQQRVRYGAVVPFAHKKAYLAILLFYKFYGFQTVKLKVGKNLEDDLSCLSLARRILGNTVTIRVDANCAWSLDKALKAVESFKPYKVSSYEQPLPADDWEGLKKLSSAIEEDIVLDESLCTLSQASLLANQKIGTAFNIRLSKSGGLIASKKIMQIAQENNLKIHMGAQVGETGILSAAGRLFALTSPPLFNYEGSANFFLLKEDICQENLTCSLGAFADLGFRSSNYGLGITICEKKLAKIISSKYKLDNEFVYRQVNKSFV